MSPWQCLRTVKHKCYPRNPPRTRGIYIPVAFYVGLQNNDTFVIRVNKGYLHYRGQLACVQKNTTTIKNLIGFHYTIALLLG